MYALEVKDLTKKYSPPSRMRRMLMRSAISATITAVDGVSFEVHDGEVFGLLGPNGAGKTTLIKLLTTLLIPTSGSASIAGHDVVKDEDKVKQKIGLVTSEERSFYWRLTGRQNLSFFAGLSNIPRSEISAKVNQVLEVVDLSAAADNMFYSYSSGMKQKLSIARALLVDPKVLFLDEPTRSVDVVAIAEIKLFIRELAQGEKKCTVLLATHRLEEAEELCDRIAIMNKGKVIFCGTVDELKVVLGGREQYTIVAYRAKLDGCLSIRDKHRLQHAEVTNPDNNGTLQICFSVSEDENPLSGVLNDIIGMGGEIVSCDKKERRLEDMFIDIVKGDVN